MERVVHKTRKQQMNDIKQDLLNQIRQNGTAGEYYINLVDDYMSLWDAKNRLIADIKRRGVCVERSTATSVNMIKNESVGELVKVNAQMLKLLDSLGIKPSQSGGEVDDKL